MNSLYRLYRTHSDLSIQYVRNTLAIQMSADKTKERQYVNVLLDESAIKRIDDFRFKGRFLSRTETIRWLLNWALDQKPSVPKGE